MNTIQMAMVCPKEPMITLFPIMGGPGIVPAPFVKPASTALHSRITSTFELPNHESKKRTLVENRREQSAGWQLPKSSRRLQRWPHQRMREGSRLVGPYDAW